MNLVDFNEVKLKGDNLHERNLKKGELTGKWKEREEKRGRRGSKGRDRRMQHFFAG